MTAAISQALPSAVGIVLATSPLLVIVLQLVTTRPAWVSTAFLLGWAAGIATVAGLLVAFVDTSSPRGLPPLAAALVRIVLGLVLGYFAVRSWRQRTASDGPPAWMARLATWSASRGFTAGYVLGALNPKNLALVAAGAASILEATTSRQAQAIAVLVFAGLASLGIATPIVLRAVGGPTLTRGLERAAAGMAKHAKAIKIVVLTALAVVLLAQGFAKL